MKRMSERIQTVIFKIRRYDPEGGGTARFDEFTVPVAPGMTVLEGLTRIKEDFDSTLTFRASCRMGICGSCAMLVNNYPRLACHTQIEELKSAHLTIKPLPNLPLIKDLVCDFAPLFARHKAVLPYIIRDDASGERPPAAEYAMTPGDLNDFLQFAYCIKCGICLAACPTSASDRLFSGPQALAQCYRYGADNRDDGELTRFKVVDGDHGVWRCHLAGACSDACPKGVDPALAIQLLKRRLAACALGRGGKRQPAAEVNLPPAAEELIPYPDFTAGRHGPAKDTV